MHKPHRGDGKCMITYSEIGVGNVQRWVRYGNERIRDSNLLPFGNPKKERREENNTEIDRDWGSQKTWQSSCIRKSDGTDNDLQSSTPETTKRKKVITGKKERGRRRGVATRRDPSPLPSSQRLQTARRRNGEQGWSMGVGGTGSLIYKGQHILTLARPSVCVGRGGGGLLRRFQAQTAHGNLVFGRNVSSILRLCTQKKINRLNWRVKCEMTFLAWIWLDGWNSLNRFSVRSALVATLLRNRTYSRR
jgi:hypothetical protein